MLRKWTHVRISPDILCRLKAFRERREAARSNGAPSCKNDPTLLSISDVIGLLLDRQEKHTIRCRTAKQRGRQRRREERMEEVYSLAPHPE